MNVHMRKIQIMKMCCVLLAMTLLLTGCGIFGPTQNKTVETNITMKPGTTLHINADVDCGTIYVKVTDQNGTVYFEEKLKGNYCCGINNYRPSKYTVTEIWTAAKGKINVYQTGIGEKAFAQDFFPRAFFYGRKVNALYAERNQ